MRRNDADGSNLPSACRSRSRASALKKKPPIFRDASLMPLALDGTVDYSRVNELIINTRPFDASITVVERATTQSSPFIIYR